MANRHINTIPGLGKRLSRLPLPDLFEAARALGIEPLQLRPEGNLASWSISGQILGAIGDQYARLDAILQHVEQRLGLESPAWYPWPLKIGYTIVALFRDGTPHLYGWCEDLNIIHIRLDSIDEAEKTMRSIIEEMLLVGWGLDVKAINTADGIRMTDGFDCLRLYCEGHEIHYEDRAAFEKALQRG